MYYHNKIISKTVKQFAIECIAVNASFVEFSKKNPSSFSKRVLHRTLLMSLHFLFDVQFYVPLKRKFVKLQLFLLD